MTGRPYADTAQAYWRAGWANPIPVRGKFPPVTGYTGYDGANVSWPDLQAWVDGEHGEWNIALRLPGDVIGIDVDAYDGKSGGESMAAARAQLGDLPDTVRSTARPPFSESGIWLYRVPAGANLRGAEKRFAARYGDHVDVIRRDHRYAVVWPSINPKTGGMYLWYGPDGTQLLEPPRPTDLAELPRAWVEFLTAPAEPTTRTTDPTPTASDTPADIWDYPREFTRDEATEFVRPAFANLRSAVDGTINNRLNEAAVTIGHFIPEFWSRAEAEAYLLDALADTAYDGKTWRAEATIKSGLEAKTWRAVRRIDPAGSTPDERDEALLREVARLHFRADAGELFAAERHARNWTAPVHHGSLSAELNLPDEDTKWRLRGLLGIGHNAVVVAGRKVGKTTVVNNLIRSCVDGEPFLNRFEVAPFSQGVAVFNYEIDERQYRRWLRDVGVVNTDRVFVLHLRGRSVPLRDVQVRGWVVRWLREREIGVWIVDPYSRAYVGSVDNGNDEAQVGAFLDLLDVVKAEAGIGELIMPAHTPKARVDEGEETAIGSQRLEAWPDSMWYLTKDADTGLRFLRAEGRDVDIMQEQLTYDGETRRLTFGGPDRASLRRRADLSAVIDYIAVHPGCSQNEIAAGLGWGKDRVRKVVKEAEGTVRTAAGKNGAFHHYADN